MAVDLTKKFIDMKSAYASARGASRPTGIRHKTLGFPLIDASKTVPATTWGDVVLIHNHLKKHAETTKQLCSGWPTNNCIEVPTFPQTAQWLEAKKHFDAQSPLIRPGLPWTEVVKKVNSGEVYPYNEELWGYGSEYAQWRNAAGAVPFWTDIAIESIKEAIQELPGVLLPSFDLPDFSAWGDILKWGSILTGGFLIYWYGLRRQK